MSKPDVVYVVGPGERPWLRYSLRSVARNLPHRTVWIVGAVPRWVAPAAGRIFLDQPAIKWDAARQNFLTACRIPAVSDEFYLFNDDFFVMGPVETVPPMHRGRLRDQIDHFTRTGLRGPYLAGMKESYWTLARAGVADPVSYDMHVPMLVDKRKWLAADRRATELREPNVRAKFSRTFYGNVNGIGGELTRDVKVTSMVGALPPGPYASTDPTSWRGMAGRMIKRTFPTPCEYEMGGQHGTTTVGIGSRP